MREPDQLPEQTNTREVGRKIREIIDYLRSIRLVAGNGLKLSTTSAGSVISLIGKSTACTGSNAEASFPFQVTIEKVNGEDKVCIAAGVWHEILLYGTASHYEAKNTIELAEGYVNAIAEDGVLSYDIGDDMEGCCIAKIEQNDDDSYSVTQLSTAVVASGLLPVADLEKVGFIRYDGEQTPPEINVVEPVECDFDVDESAGD